VLYDWATVVIVFFFLIRLGIKAIPQIVRELQEARSILEAGPRPASAVPVTTISNAPQAVPTVTLSSLKTEVGGNLSLLTSKQTVSA
jgi:hypothetical protein